MFQLFDDQVVYIIKNCKKVFVLTTVPPAKQSLFNRFSSILLPLNLCQLKKIPEIIPFCDTKIYFKVKLKNGIIVASGSILKIDSNVLS